MTTFQSGRSSWSGIVIFKVDHPMAFSKYIVVRKTSDWLHGRDRLRRSSRSWLCRLPRNVVLSNHICKRELRQHHLWHGCISHQAQPSTSKRCSNLSKPDCHLQGSYHPPKSWNHSKSNSSTVSGHKRERGRIEHTALLHGPMPTSTTLQ